MKRAYFSFIILLVLSLSIFLHEVNAAENWKMSTIESYSDALYTGLDMNLQSHVKSTFDTFGYAFSDATTGTACARAAQNANQGADCVKNSLTGKINQTIADMYSNPPADTGMWIADVGHTLGFIPDKVYAQGQGIGFSGLTPLLPIWKAFRNIAYLLMAVVMMVLGFMIMFRKKIDPKTVVTAQNAIPRVVIALILITFSYAIVGIMIDIMYLLLYFAIALFSTVPNFPKMIDGRTASQFFSQAGLFDIMASPVGAFDPYKILFGVNMGGKAGTLAADAGISIIAIATAIFSAPVAAVAGLGPALPYASMPLIHIIVSLAILFLFIRLLAFFLMTYVQIIISLIFAPLQLIAEALPGSEAFSSWFKNLVANLAVFPIAGIMFMLATMFSNMSSVGDGLNINILNPSASTLPTADTSGFWAPPFTTLNMHWFGTTTNSNNMTAVTALLALGVLFAIPTVAGSIKEMLKAKPMFAGGGGGGGGFASALSYGSQISSLVYYMKHIKGEKAFPQMLGGKPPPGVEHER